jgi:hypothetical protein
MLIRNLIYLSTYAHINCVNSCHVSVQLFDMTISGDLLEFDATLDLLCGASSFEISFIQTQTVRLRHRDAFFLHCLILGHVCMNINRRAERVRKVRHKMDTIEYWLA